MNFICILIFDRIMQGTVATVPCIYFLYMVA